MLCHPLFVKWLRKEGTNVRFYRISTIYVSNFSSLYGSSLSAGREGVICLLGSGCGGVAPRCCGGGAPAGVGVGHQLGRGRGTSWGGAPPRQENIAILNYIMRLAGAWGRGRCWAVC